MTQQFSQADIDAAIAEGKRFVAEHWGWFMVLGIVLLILGIAAIAFPQISSLAVELWVGWTLLIAGIAFVIHAFTAKDWGGGFWLQLLLGVLYVLAGASLVVFPVSGMVTLTVLLAALFLAEGVLQVIMSLRVRGHGGWIWLLISGLIAIAAGALIALKLPSSAAWALGLLAGINLISTGWGFVFMALAGRRVQQGAPATA